MSCPSSARLALHLPPGQPHGHPCSGCPKNQPKPRPSAPQGTLPELLQGSLEMRRSCWLKPLCGASRFSTGIAVGWGHTLLPSADRPDSSLPRHVLRVGVNPRLPPPDVSTPAGRAEAATGSKSQDDQLMGHQRGPSETHPQNLEPCLARICLNTPHPALYCQTSPGRSCCCPILPRSASSWASIVSWTQPHLDLGGRDPAGSGFKATLQSLNVTDHDLDHHGRPSRTNPSLA